MFQAGKPEDQLVCVGEAGWLAVSVVYAQVMGKYAIEMEQGHREL